MVHGNEIEGHTQNIVRLALAGIVLVILATVLMGSVDVGTTSPNMRGEWNVHVNAQPTACSGSGRRRLDLYVDAEGIIRIVTPLEGNEAALGVDIRSLDVPSRTLAEADYEGDYVFEREAGDDRVGDIGQGVEALKKAMQAVTA